MPGIMGSTVSKQRIYASLLALGACILLYRTIMMLSQGALNTLVLWVSILLFAELLLDLSCLLSSIFWWIKNDKNKSRIPLRLGAVAALLHAVRVLIFVLGRVGPWIDFDVRPDQIEMQYTRWTWTGVYFAAILAVLGIIGVIIIWILIRRAKNINYKRVKLGGTNMTDWKLVSKGLLGIYWIMKCNNTENAERTLIDVYSKDFAKEWNGERLLNSGVLMMASYLLFVYPQQADFNTIDFSAIDISKFNIIQEDSDNSESKKFCRRLRNSISHSRFVVDEKANIINFRDEKGDGSDKIEVEIGEVDFGIFIDNFAHTVNRQMIDKT